MTTVSTDTPEIQPELRIVAAAIYHGGIFSLPRPARHHTILNALSCILNIDATRIPPANQGFITSDGNFVNRTEGYYIAWRAKQLNERERGSEPVLFSEDMW